MSVSILRPARNSNGNKVHGLWNLIVVRFKKSGFCVSWSKHVDSCRYGFYWNRNWCGLKSCINIPMIGDFALWV